jgi:hypothetical protein
MDRRLRRRDRTLAAAAVTVRPLLVVPLVLAGLAAFAATRPPVSDSDLFWHLAIGRDIAAHGVPRVDVYSWTVAGGAVLPDQWLGELLLYAAYAIGSWTGPIALRALTVGALIGIVLWTAVAERPRRPFIAVLASLPAIGVSRFAWTDRPELFGLLCFAILIALLCAARRGSLVAFALCVPLVLLWTNLHGSWALGLGLVLVVALERAVVDPSRRRRYAAVAIASVLATFVTPAGLATWTSSGGHFLAPPRFVQEEGTPDVTTLPGLLFSVALLASLATAMLAPRARGRDGLFEIAVLVPVAFVSLTATRHLVFFPIAAAPFLSLWGPDAWAEGVRTLREGWGETVANLVKPITMRTRGRTAQGDPRPYVVEGGPPEHGRPRGLIADGIATVIALVMLIAGLATAPRDPDLSSFPMAALPQLPAGPGLLNRYDWGGFLIWYAPATPVFVDGRLFPYVGEALNDYRAVIGLHPDWRQVLAKRGIRTVLVAPSDAIAVQGVALGWPILARTPEWVMLRVP